MEQDTKNCHILKKISEKFKTRKKMIGSTIMDIWMHLSIDTERVLRSHISNLNQVLSFKIMEPQI